MTMPEREPLPSWADWPIQWGARRLGYVPVCSRQPSRVATVALSCAEGVLMKHPRNPNIRKGAA